MTATASTNAAANRAKEQRTTAVPASDSEPSDSDDDAVGGDLLVAIEVRVR